MLVDFVFLCPSKKVFVRFVLGNRRSCTQGSNRINTNILELFAAHDEYGTGRMAHDVLGNAAHEHALDAGLPEVTHDDHIKALVLSDLHDIISGVSTHGAGAQVHAKLPGPGRHIIQGVLAFLAKPEVLLLIASDVVVMLQGVKLEMLEVEDE